MNILNNSWSIFSRKRELKLVSKCRLTGDKSFSLAVYSITASDGWVCAVSFEFHTNQGL